MFWAGGTEETGMERKSKLCLSSWQSVAKNLQLSRLTIEIQTGLQAMIEISFVDGAVVFSLSICDGNFHRLEKGNIIVNVHLPI